jgi:hypothetical protein
MNTGMTLDRSKFDAWAKRMLSMEAQKDAALQAIVYPMLFAGDGSAQAQRWMSEGASEGDVWSPLDPAYARRKLRKHAGDPGGGTKLLVATGRLLGANTGRPTESGDLNKVIQGGVLYVRLDVPYAKFVNKRREIKKFSAQTIQNVRAAVRQYFSDRIKP